MIEHAGIALFVFGNKKDGSGKLIEFDGMREEFDLCVASGVVPIPIGATGYMAETLWREVDGRFAHFFPRRTLRFGRVSRQSATTQQHHLS